ncbi:hypothetical protein LJC64_02605 [Ruminococcaceae bacterium OttesenSCG-928-A11]|nr:hypothetical protein [Ruminococcaceae bacterium OttesenSCG-928-A11]
MDAFDYKAAYFHLLGEMATATEELQANKTQKALSRLILAQLNAEEWYTTHADGVGVIFPKQKKPPDERER